MMAKRPYFNNRIEELETVFKLSQNNQKVLKELANELQFRNTIRAKKLYEDIKKILKVHSLDSKSLPNAGDTNSDRSDIVSVPDQTETLTVEINTDNIKKIEPPLPERPVVHEDSGLELNANRELNGNLTTTFDKSEPPKAEAIISAWLTQEILTPQPLPSEEDLRAYNRRLVSLEEIREPWKDDRFNKRGKETAVFWMLYLGELNLAKAMEFIIRMFPDEMADERSEIRGNTTIAVLVVDSQGKLIPDKAFLSSFA
jgi:hypothetical protein